MSGVTVTFVVDSGGGSLDATTAVTSSDGSAMSGNWTLGNVEGRNVMHASVASLPPVKFVAAAVIVPVALPAQTVTTSGGSVVINRPGSPADGFTVTVPAAAFPSAVSIVLSYESSATVPRPAGLELASPVIAVATDAPALSDQPLVFTFPVKAPAGKVAFVAMVDPATGFLDVLHTLSSDSASITVMNSVHDEAMAREGSGASIRASSAWNASLHAGVLPSARAASVRARYVLVLAEAGRLNTLTYDSGFRPGVDDWEFPSDYTPLRSTLLSTDAGMMVSERYYFAMQKSLTQGALHKKFQEARGAIGSNSVGERWSAGLAKQFSERSGAVVAKANTARAAAATAYDASTMASIVMSLYASQRPQIIGLYNPTVNAMAVVMAYKWDGASGLLYYADPRFPGDVTKKLSYRSASGFQCPDGYCVIVSGFNHFIGYQTQLNAEYPLVTNGTIYKSLFPQAFMSSHETAVPNTVSPGFDTIFVLKDTTRFWVECATCTGQLPFPASITAKHGAVGIQSERVYTESAGDWTKYPGQSTTGFATNVLSFTGATRKYADFLLGFEGRALVSANIQAPVTGWLGWKVYRVIRFNPILEYPRALPGAAATFTLSADGGPTLPPDATYTFDWGDQSGKTVLSTRPTTLQHTYESIGSYAVTLKVTHKTAGITISETTTIVEVKHGAIVWQMETAVVTSAGPPFSGDSGDSVRYNYVVSAMNQLALSVRDNQVLTWTSPDTVGILWQKLAPGKGGTTTGYDPSALRLFFLGYAGNMTKGRVGGGALTGRYNDFDDEDTGMRGPLGLEQTINATMIPGFLLGRITIASFWEGVGPTYTIEFSAKQIVP
ncbi:MAG: PKD domain-containing protein [Gemmatimonadaceae bacterium]|nr:PKD domain-containing protein [Gemmatimonadaceae bacterium]